MRFTNLSSIRALLALALLVLIGGAFVVVGNSDDPAGAREAAATTTTTTTVRTAVGLVSGELAAQSQQVEATSTPVAPTDGSARALARTSSQESTTLVSTTTTAVLETTTTTIAVTTTTAPTTTTTAAPTTTIPETTTTAPTTTTTVPETTTTTVPETTTTTTGPPAGVVLSEAQARDMFGLYFAAEDVDRAIEVAVCESGLNTAAYNPAGYAGLFQHGIAFWDDRAASAGWSGASIYDGNANAAVAAWLVYSSGWQHWPNC